MKLTGKYQVLWEAGNVVIEIENTGLTVTECWRQEVEGYESEDLIDIDTKVAEKEIKRLDNPEHPEHPDHPLGK
jgi:hypothetical protein